MGKTLKLGIILIIMICLLLLAVAMMDLPFLRNESDVAAQSASTPAAGDPDLTAAVKAALRNDGGTFTEEGYLIDHIQIQDDGQVAAVWLAAIDPETGDPIGREPELFMAKLDDQGNWQILLRDEEKFGSVFQDFQYAGKSIQGDLDREPDPYPKDPVVYGGYYLPWAQNLTKRLTWSVGHTSCTPTYYCTHAFDFADGSMFPMVAAKGGTVYHWKDTCNNGDTSCTNSITLQDRSTTPWTYQIYLHIAKGSVPANLKKVGTPVLQGQYIADVDDTGYSTGHHVHFMVVSQTTVYQSWNGYTWGRAEDITFRDVSINWDRATQGGRPRLQYEANSYGGQGQTSYTSGNKPAHPPTGALTAPAAKTYITNPNLNVTGWGQDDIRVTKFEILAKYGEDWVTIKEQPGTTLSTSVNLCDAGVPDGPFDLALRVWDYEGNPSAILSVRRLIKNTACGAAGTEPTVTLQQTGGKVLLPQAGMVNATVAKGSTNAAISFVEFWFHDANWHQGTFQNLGKDEDGTNGWQAPFSAGSLAEASNYTLMAIATDTNGQQGATVTFMAILDRTSPWLTPTTPTSPFMGNSVTITWTGGDDLTDVDRYAISVKVNDAPFQLLDGNLPRTTTSYPYDVNKEQLYVFEVRAFDLVGNEISRKVAVYTEGYEFDYSYTFPTFFNSQGD